MMKKELAMWKTMNHPLDSPARQVAEPQYWSARTKFLSGMPQLLGTKFEP
jgi:hypothetical protein